MPVVSDGVPYGQETMPPGKNMALVFLRLSIPDTWTILMSRYSILRCTLHCSQLFALCLSYIFAILCLGVAGSRAAGGIT